jgi:deoxyadenosine/deoxycytidine kinase
MNKKPFYLSVMGTMGSGKTTAARLIARHFHYHLVEENFGENAFLPRFYQDMHRWSFHSQTFFLMEKMNQLMEIKKELCRYSKRSAGRERGVVQDTPIEQDVFSYAKAQHKMGQMDEAEWRLYHKIYTSFLPHLPKPDCIIYLETSLPVVMDRITKRGRGFEQKIPKKYLSLLATLNEEWIAAQQKIPILRIQTDTLNIVRSPLAQQTFLSTISSSLSLTISSRV